MATLVGRELELRGSDFGTVGSVRIGLVEIASDAPGSTWQDDRIVVTLPAGVLGGAVVAITAFGESNAVPLEVYSYESFPIPVTAQTSASPLALAVDFAHRVFINEEFHRAFQWFDPASAGVSALPAIPWPPDPGPFAAFFDPFCLGGNCSADVDIRTQTSILGEDVVVDDRGHVWFSEGGANLYEQRVSTHDSSLQVMVHPNHSRIVRFDPVTSGYRVYNVPGDRNEVVGMAWDGQLIWFAQGGRVGGGTLTSFDPERTPFDTIAPTFDFSTSLDQYVNVPDGSGYQVYPVTDPQSYPAFPLPDPDGHVWFSMYLGNALGRLDPASGTVETFPLPPPVSHSLPALIFATGGPWRMLFTPDYSAILFNEQFDLQLSRLDAARVRSGDPACQSLDGQQQNPCVTSLPVADPDVFTGPTDLAHSIAWDALGRLWYTQHGSNQPAAPDRLGFLLPDGQSLVKLPPLRRPQDAQGAGAAGVAVDPSNGDIWFVEYFARAVSRLRKL